MEQTEQQPTEQQQTEGYTSEELLSAAEKMKENAPQQDEKHNVHTFLVKVVEEADSTKIANLRDDKELNELGVPSFPVRGAKEMALISREIMDNEFFAEYFEKEAENTLATSLSREGFLIRQATTTTKQVGDITRRRRITKGLFKKQEEVQGGDANER